MGKLEIKNEKFHSDGILENTTRLKNLVEVIEVDDYTESFKIFLKIEIEQFQQLILYENNLWIQYEIWEKFLKS